VTDSIRFEGVSFTYPGGFHRALDGFELEIPQGKVVALVGHNGAGKSTLIKLLCRFYDPTQGGFCWTEWTCASWTRLCCAARLRCSFKTLFTTTPRLERTLPLAISTHLPTRRA